MLQRTITDGVISSVQRVAMAISPSGLSPTVGPKLSPETPILIVAKNGIKEIEKDILKEFPVAIHDMNSNGKNLMLISVENRQPHVLQLLLKSKSTKSIDDLLHCLNNEGNSALHLATMLKTYQPWLAPNATLQMQCEIKWYECIKEHLPKHLVAHQNNGGKTAQEIFIETHSELVQNDTVVNENLRFMHHRSSTHCNCPLCHDGKCAKWR
ncbi:Homeobox-leucine zipper protein REVOLUTA [Camellia lanceoleosa]|uniref:Homeobox-leucine zipper protein REVOLUTA n=1 Tax=Camellia lanceoleosa TaxID=1840588 RepID=A0ACC0F770_9ERIC|nr:Homeobox-leucine zipper protein REVOLUTA [Camellia lanceoleosa]